MWPCSPAPLRSCTLQLLGPGPLPPGPVLPLLGLFTGRIGLFTCDLAAVINLPRSLLPCSPSCHRSPCACNLHADVRSLWGACLCCSSFQPCIQQSSTQNGWLIMLVHTQWWAPPSACLAKAAKAQQSSLQQLTQTKVRCYFWPPPTHPCLRWSGPWRQKGDKIIAQYCTADNGPEPLDTRLNPDAHRTQYTSTGSRPCCNWTADVT